MFNWKKFFIIICLLSTIFFIPQALLAVDGDPTGTSLKNSITGGLETTGKAAKYDTSKKGDEAIVSLVGAAIKIILGILGIILLGLITYAGFLWMTAGGDTDQVGKAKDYIKNAIIGLIIVTASYIIADFVMDQLTSVTNTTPTTETSTFIRNKILS